MSTKNDDVSQSALHTSANEDEQAAQLKELSERVTRLESFILDRSLSIDYLKSLQSRLEEEASHPATDFDASYIRTFLAAMKTVAMEKTVEELLQHMPSPASAARQNEPSERKQRLLQQLDEWLADDSGYDEETWPKLKTALEQDRLSSRSLFDE